MNLKKVQKRSARFVTRNYSYETGISARFVTRNYSYETGISARFVTRN